MALSAKVVLCLIFEETTIRKRILNFLFEFF